MWELYFLGMWGRGEGHPDPYCVTRPTCSRVDDRVAIVGDKADSANVLLQPDIPPAQLQRASFVTEAETVGSGRNVPVA